MTVKRLTRRAWFGVLAAVGVASVTKLGDAKTPTSPYGVVDLNRWHALGFRQRHARVLLDGEDVTDRCFLFVDSPVDYSEWMRARAARPDAKHNREYTSYALLYVLDADGRECLGDDRSMAVERRHGRIEVV